MSNNIREPGKGTVTPNGNGTIVGDVTQNDNVIESWFYLAKNQYRIDLIPVFPKKALTNVSFGIYFL
ncbi:MAG: hypothetical protein QM610_08210 [Chitinophagaceae bacterium]